MIASIEEALAKLREHCKFCQRLDCEECDLHADVADLLLSLQSVGSGSSSPVEEVP
jgi:hypothetical protein